MRAFAANEKFAQQIRQRTKPQLVVETEFRLRIAARNRVADDDEVGLVREVALAVAVHHLDLPLGEKGGHGRINILVRAGDGEPLLLQRRGRRGHRRAADADKMN